MDTEYTKAFKAGYDFGYKDAANENRYNTGVKVGIAYEHDRIIKLLEQSEIHWRCREGCCYCLGWNGDEPINQLGYLIELIKGKA